MEPLAFKVPALRKQFAEVPHALQMVVWYFVAIVRRRYGITPVVTRVSDPLGYGTESGVHPEKRAVDLRDQFNGVHTYTPEQREELLADVNATFPRDDGKLVLIHHSANGDPDHWHLQIPAEWA